MIVGVAFPAVEMAGEMEMDDSTDTFQHKLFFLLSSVLIAANLIVVSLNFASPSANSSLVLLRSTLYKSGVSVSRQASTGLHSAAFAGGRAAKDAGGAGSAGLHAVTDTVGSGVHAITHTAGSVTKFAASTTSLTALITPATNLHGAVPVITPLPAPVTVAAPIAPAPIQQPQPQPARVAETVAPAPVARFSAYNAYAWGNCTWWASIRRSQINEPIPNSWGNATSWAARASADGYRVDHSPSPGAIMQISGVDYGLGHVAFVESVDRDGTWHISEMNVLGLDVTDHKAEPASAASNYSFIHNKV